VSCDINIFHTAHSIISNKNWLSCLNPSVAAGTLHWKCVVAGVLNRRGVCVFMNVLMPGLE
jgi:hypothetical protein